MPPLTPEHFWLIQCQVVWETLQEMKAKGDLEDFKGSSEGVLRLSQWLKDAGRLADVGGAAGLDAIMGAVSTVDYLERHVSKLKRMKFRRDGIKFCEERLLELFDLGSDELETWNKFKKFGGCK